MVTNANMLRIARTVLIAVIAMSCFAMTVSHSDDFRLTIYRQYPDAKCTSGYLAVNDNIVSYTLERPWKENQQNVSSIPAGTYKAIVRYDHTDHWRVELLDVPNRTNVQIHIGNEVDESKGCILVGTKLGADLCSIVGGTSAPAYKKIKAAFYGTDNPTSTPDKNISVTIKDAGPQNGD
jgi:hypothetical protein